MKEGEAKSFRENLTCLGFSPSAVLPHAGYLINPATPDKELSEKSLALFMEEARRVTELGLDVINIHPGAYKEGERIDGIRRSAAMMDRVLEAYPNLRIAVEDTAGSGTIIGSSFE